ncbi:MAG: hypothetical protein RIR79_1135, partial [Pseudomonadota bacterium]
QLAGRGRVGTGLAIWFTPIHAIALAEGIRL